MLHFLDWCVIAAYILFAITVGLILRRRAGKNVDEYFLSGRSLPWWLAGTSMIATSFAADTPLLISGMVRDFGIWKNWTWWCFCIGNIFVVFLFARWWRRSLVMTKAELVELRYGDRDAKILRGVLGFMHAGVTNTLILCWVLLAAGKIVDVLFGIEAITILGAEIPGKSLGIIIACLLALSYSLLAGFWGVVVTDLVQFIISAVGAVVLAFYAWQYIGGGEAILNAISDGSHSITAATIAIFPNQATANLQTAQNFTHPFYAIPIYLGVAWWASEGIDGSGVAVQRICASRDDKQGMFAYLWFCIIHYGLRPWPWIIVGLASLLVLDKLEMRAPVQSTVISIDLEQVTLLPVTEKAAEKASPITLELNKALPAGSDWKYELIKVEKDSVIEQGQLIARSDPERAYVVMMKRLLPVGLLGLVIASLLAAFMSTIDTHVNLASSYFVNDIYRRFIKPGVVDGSYVIIARIASACALILGATFAMMASSILDLFQLFLALLSGVGPVYVLRWLWWRITARVEIAAMLTSAMITGSLLIAKNCDHAFASTESARAILGPYIVNGVLQHEGRLMLVCGISTVVALIVLLCTSKPKPQDLVAFYKRVRPLGVWGPVRELSGLAPYRESKATAVGIVSGLACVFGLLFGIGDWLLLRPVAATICLGIASLGGLGIFWSIRKIIRHEQREIM